MALPSTVYKATIQLADIDRSRYESLSVTVARHPSETEERLAARLVAYAVFYEDDLTFTRGLSAGDEPDIWVKGGDDRIRLWVEVGLPDSERIVKASRHAEQVTLLAYGRALSTWEHQHLPKLVTIPNIRVVSFEQPLIARLAKKLERVISWGITITEGICYLTADGETLEMTLHYRT